MLDLFGQTAVPSRRAIASGETFGGMNYRAIPSVRDPSAVAFGLVFAKICDETFGGTFGDMRAAAQVWQLTQYSVSC